MGDPTLNRATLRNKFELEKRHRSYADFRSKVVKSLPEVKSSPSNCSQQQKPMEMDEIVKHMKHLPGYLERGKPIQDRALSFGVMDWGRLEKWRDVHQKQGLVGNIKCSPSSSNSSSLFSTDGSSPWSSRGQSCSPVHQKIHRVTLQSHFKASPNGDSTPHINLCSGNMDKFLYINDPPNYSKSLHDMGTCHTPPSSCLKGKLKIQDESVNEQKYLQDTSCRIRNDAHPKKHEDVLFLARTPGYTQVNCNTQNPSTFQSEDISYKKSQMELNSARNLSSPSRSKTLAGKRSPGSSKNSDLKTSNAVSKPRSTSPLRRFSFSLGTNSKTAAPTSATERDESPMSRNVTRDGTRTHSSPLRRLLDPIFPAKGRQFAEIYHEDSRIKAKAKLDFRNSKETRADDDVISSRKQALFQTTVKNDRLLFTFAVENDKDILAATVTSLSSSGKYDNKNRLYTFFTVQEVKKKTINWLSQGNKSKDHDYVPNVTAQMKVSNPSSSRCDAREFVLYSVNSNLQPQEELEAIVVKFPRKLDREDNQESFSTTVIQPGGSHGIPSKGGPSPLIYRWRSGGVCDCGGWDVGCRLRTLSNQLQSSGSRSEKPHTTTGQFVLSVQGEVQNKRPMFILSPLKESIFSVEYESSLSSLQAFSICISVVECRKASQHTELRTHPHEEVPQIYTPIPRIKRNTTGKITSL